LEKLNGFKDGSLPKETRKNEFFIEEVWRSERSGEVWRSARFREVWGSKRSMIRSLRIENGL